MKGRFPRCSFALHPARRDEGITCLVCRAPKVDYELYAKRLPLGYGIHARCLGEKSKGSPSAPDLTGRTDLGLWIVLRRATDREACLHRRKHRRAFWLCECQGCRRTFVVAGDKLRRGLSKACLSCSRRVVHLRARAGTALPGHVSILAGLAL